MRLCEGRAMAVQRSCNLRVRSALLQGGSGRNRVGFMELLNKLRGVHPYTPKRYDVLYDDASKIKEPLIARDPEEDAFDGNNSDDGEEHMPFLRKITTKGEESWYTRVVNRLAPSDGNRSPVKSSGYMLSVEPKFLRSMGSTWTDTASDRQYRAQVKTRRKAETMDDIVDRALARCAYLTVAFAMVLILAIYHQSPET